MTWFEYVAIGVAALIVIAVIWYEVKKHKSGKSSCDCCSGGTKKMSKGSDPEVETHHHHSPEEQIERSYSQLPLDKALIWSINESYIAFIEEKTDKPLFLLNIWLSSSHSEDKDDPNWGVTKTNLVVLEQMKKDADNRQGSNLNKWNKTQPQIITVDRSIRVGALRSTLDPIITDLSNNDDLDDNSRNKVNNYDLLSEFGLETLLFLQKNKDLEDRYLINLYANIFKYFESNKIAFPGFEQILMAEVVRDNDPIIVNARLNRVFDDIDNEIDGISVKLARKIFYNTLTDNEILYLGDKYRVSIPERLTKRDLINEIVKQPSGENPEQLKLKLMRMSISMLESYVSQNHL
ncbi:MAG: hypothetical protein EZS28_038973, partial [Streblomastix strix]